MLAKLGNLGDLKRKGFIFEPKLDGTRVLIFKKENSLKLINRRGKNIIYRYPELNSIKNNIKENAVLDGELVVLEKGKPSFQLLSEREHIDSKLKIELKSKIYPATIFVFDILQLGSKKLVNLPLIKRKEFLKRVLKENERIKLCFFTKRGLELWNSIKKMGLEGVVAKKEDSPYLFERSEFWLKIKNLKTLDCLICGYTTGTGKRKNFGSLILGCYYKGKLIYVGKVGTGFNEKEIKEIRKELEKIKGKIPFKEKPELDLPENRKPIWVKPKLICEVKFLELSENLIMRAPSFLRIRNDKKPKDCILDYSNT